MNNAPTVITDFIEKPSGKGIIARIKGMNRLFIITVVLPTLIAAVYFGFIASDVYISESKFIIRSPDQQSASPLGIILKGAGFSRSQDDSYSVQEYILSRDALRVLDDRLNIRKAFSSKYLDIISRFGGLDFDDSLEALFKYYQKKVDVQLDSSSSIVTLTTRAFTVEDSSQMNQLLLELSETLINKLNDRGRQDMISFATHEVAEAEKKDKESALNLARYRNEKGVIDPEKQSTIPLQQIAKMQDELIATKTQLAQLRSLAKDNPQIESLKIQEKTLVSEIAFESTRVAGGGLSLASKAAEYQRLVLEKEFSGKMLASAMNTLEQARNEAVRKQLYLERIAEPSKPDKALEPRRLRAIFAVFILGLIIWGVLTMLVTGIKEHQD